MGIPLFLETPTSIQHAPPNRLQLVASHPFLKIADGCFFSMAKKVHRPGGGGKCRGGVDLGVEGFTALVGQLNRKLLDWEAISSVPTQMILDQKGGVTHFI